MTTTIANELQVFMSEQFGQLRVIEYNGKPYVVGNDVAKALEYVRPYEAVTSHCKGTVTYRVLTKGGEQDVKIIPEGDIYRLITKAADQSKNKDIKLKAEKFESWVFDVVLPTIRKTGGFVADEKKFIDTYLPFADEPTKLLFKSTLAVITNQNGIIAKQKLDIDHKGDIIKGLIEDMTLADKRQILNRVVMKCSNFNDRWRELYRTYELKYHLLLDARLNSYNKTHTPQLRNKLEYIEAIGKIDELFAITCKLYENEVNVLVQEMYKLHEVELVQ